MKTCYGCDEDKPLDSFSKDSLKPDGKDLYCRSCKATKDKQRRDKYKKPFYDYKLEMGCEMCGYNEHSAALQFDHIDPSTKEATIADMIRSGKKAEAVWAEIAKCRVLCANCHMVHTHG